MNAANDNAPANAQSASKSGKQCPVCGKPRVQAMAPFCSKRCADVDLHRWLGGRYVIPLEPDPNADPLNAEFREVAGRTDRNDDLDPSI